MKREREIKRELLKAFDNLIESGKEEKGRKWKERKYIEYMMNEEWLDGLRVGREIVKYIMSRYL